jgi:hypothetical protein
MKFMSGIVLPVGNSDDYLPSSTTLQMISIGGGAMVRVMVFDATFNNISHGHDRMVVGFITTYAIGSYHLKRCEFKSWSGEVYSLQHYVIKFLSDLQQVSGFLQVLLLPPPIKLI